MLTESAHMGDFILYEEELMSRETVTITGGNYPAGAVLGKDANGKYAAVLAASTATAVLYANTDASAADKKAVVLVRLAALKSANLTWPAAITAPQKVTLLGVMTAQNLIVR